MGNITIKSVWSATVEEIVSNLTYWEDPDLDIVITETETGGIRVMRRDHSKSYGGNTIKEALIRLGIGEGLVNVDPQKYIEWEELDLRTGNSLVLDWRDADVPVQV